MNRTTEPNRDDTLFAHDFKPEPYWWDRSPPASGGCESLPARTDVAIIGAGYTGLHAAIQTARLGLSTVVLDAEAAGWGCSTRNGGQVSTSIKPSFAALSRRYGPTLALDILKEGQASLEFVESFIAEESIDCDFHIPGRFHGAHTARHYDRLCRECEQDNPAFDTGAFMVARTAQHGELGTDAYHGGMVLPHHASLDPGRYHRGISQVAHGAGALIVSHCPVRQLERSGAGFLLNTDQGPLAADRVIIASNGYTGALTPWHRRRVIPIGSYVIATETIAPEIMDRLMPTNRVLSDTRKLVYYYRPSPDRSRILFGGRVSLGETDAYRSGPRLREELVRLFPELKRIRISHSWGGFVAYTFDTLAHTGHQDGLFHAMGYCGSGVGMASYLGMRIGRQAAGASDGATAFDQLDFSTRPLYRGRPWFLAPSVLFYRLRDRIGA